MRREDEQGGLGPATWGHPAATRPREQMEGPRGTSSPKRLRRCREVKVKPGVGALGLARAPGPPGHRLAPTRPRQPPSWGCFLGTGHGSSSEGDVVGARRGLEQNKEALTAKVPGNHSGARAKYFHREVSAPQPGRRQPPRHGCRPKRMLGAPPGCSDPPRDVSCWVPSERVAAGWPQKASAGGARP